MIAISPDAPRKRERKSRKTPLLPQPKPKLDYTILNHIHEAKETKHGRLIKSAASIDKPIAQSKTNLKAERQFIEDYEKQGIIVYDGLEDPLDDVEKGILHDNFRRDGMTRRCLTFLAQFILGKRTKVVLDTNVAFASEDREESAIKQLNENPLFVSILDEIATIDADLNLYNRLKELIMSAYNYGRGVLVKQYDKDGIVNNLVPLWSVRLGKVYVDADTHNLLGVEYKDYEGEARILDAADIIYFTVDDYPITPNSRYFGLPPTETTMALALSNRITVETAINEAVFRHWAPARVITAPTIQGQKNLDDFAARIKPGKDIITNQENLKVETIDLDVDITKIMQSVEERDKEISRSLTVPLVVSFQDEQNRATASSSLHQWTESVLKDRRTDLRNTIEEQYYLPLLKSILRRRQKTEGPQTETEYPSEPNRTEEPIVQELPQLSAQTLPNVPNDPLPLDPDPLLQSPVLGISISISDMDPNNPPFRIKMQFDDIIFDTFLEKSAAVIGLKQAGILNTTQALETVGLDRFIEEAQIAEAQQPQQQPTVTPGTPTIDNGNGQGQGNAGLGVNPPNLPTATGGQ